MYDDEFVPETEPAGSLDPPRRKPPTAVAADASAPAPGERPLGVRAWKRKTSVSVVARTVHSIFDALDAIGDTIAEKAGLRARP